MKTNLSLSTLSALTIVFVFYTGCSPQKVTPLAEVKSQTSDSSNIVGGVLANQDFQKEHGVVGLAIFTSDIFDQEGMALCTGTLIDKRVILTAAHCIVGSSKSRVTAVAAYFKTDINSVGQDEIIFIDKAAPHADFLKGVSESQASDAVVWNDIAILRLASDAPSDIKIAKLPLKSDSIKIDAKSKLMLAGFGIATPIVNKKKRDPKTGKFVIVPVVEKVKTSGTLRKIENVAVVSVTTDSKEIKLNQKNSKGACHGDSGGPAFLKLEDGSQLQVGVTSRGTEALGNCNQFAIYTGVIGHLDWIEATSLAILK